MTATLIEVLANRKGLVPVNDKKYRLYHDQNGRPLFYSTDELPGLYIEIDHATYTEGRYDVDIIEGKLVRRDQFTYRKLVPGDTGISCHPEDIMIIQENGKKWEIKHYAD